MKSNVTTVDAYVASLPTDRQETVRALLAVIRANIPKGYEESILWGMPCWSVPLERYPNTYNKQPLMLAAMASQKNHYAAYLILPDLKPWFVAAYAKTGKKLDMGGSCVRFKKLEDVPLDLIGEAVGKVGVDEYLAYYERTRGSAPEKAKIKSSLAAAKKKVVKRVAKATSAKASAVRAAARTEAARSKAGTVKRAKPKAPKKTAARKQATARRKKGR